MNGLRTARRLMMGVAAAVIVGAAAAGWGHLVAVGKQAEIERLRISAEATQRLMTTVSDVEGQFRGYLLQPLPDRRERLDRAVARLDNDQAGQIVAEMQDALGNTDSLVLRENLRRLAAQRRRGIHLLEEGRQDTVIESLRNGGPQMTTDETRDLLGNFLHDRIARAAALQGELDSVNGAVLTLVLLSSLTTLAAMALAWTLIRRRSLQAEEARAGIAARGAQMEALLRAGDLLQACESTDEVASVAADTAQRLLPGTPGALYMFSNSRDRLDLSTSWPAGAERPADAPARAEHFAPEACWALRRARPHRQGDGGLHCAHLPEAGTAGACLCIPMQARGEIHGLFCLDTENLPGAAAPALADAMSMALANIQLRERLRAQAMRDPLTGLFNRRYLEEAAGGILHHAERRGAPVSVAVLDADHFKRVNDLHGHAAGDAVLRSIAGVMQGSLRRSDISCRYGGEEFVLLMPDCDGPDAESRLNEVRRQVERQHQKNDLPPVTLSAGVATIPADAATLEDAIARADAALYAAKSLGRNRVVRALPASGLAEGALREDALADHGG